MRPTATLRGWHQFGQYLVGFVYNHTGRPDLTDGMHIHTSTIVELDFDAKTRRGTCKTLNTDYTLEP